MVSTHNSGVMILIPPCVTIKMPLERKATGNHLIKSISLYLVSAALKIEYGTQCDEMSFLYLL